MEAKNHAILPLFRYIVDVHKKICLFVVLSAEYAQMILTTPPDCAIINLQTTRGNVDKNSRLNFPVSPDATPANRKTDEN